MRLILVSYLPEGMTEWRQAVEAAGVANQKLCVSNATVRVCLYRREHRTRQFSPEK